MTSSCRLLRRAGGVYSAGRPHVDAEGNLEADKTGRPVRSPSVNQSIGGGVVKLSPKRNRALRPTRSRAFTGMAIDGVVGHCGDAGQGLDHEVFNGKIS